MECKRRQGKQGLDGEGRVLRTGSHAKEKKTNGGHLGKESKMSLNYSQLSSTTAEQHNEMAPSSSTSHKKQPTK